MNKCTTKLLLTDVALIECGLYQFFDKLSEFEAQSTPQGMAQLISFCSCRNVSSIFQSSEKTEEMKSSSTHAGTSKTALT